MSVIDIIKIAKEELFEDTTKAILEKEISSFSGTYLIETTFEETSDVTIVRAVIGGLNPPSAEQVGIIEESLPTPPDDNRIELRIRFVQMQTISRNGLIYSDAEYAPPELSN